jgi:hypothetical protein
MIEAEPAWKAASTGSIIPGCRFNSPRSTSWSSASLARSGRSRVWCAFRVVCGRGASCNLTNGQKWGFCDIRPAVTKNPDVTKSVSVTSGVSVMPNKGGRPWRTMLKEGAAIPFSTPLSAPQGRSPYKQRAPTPRAVFPEGSRMEDGTGCEKGAH